MPDLTYSLANTMITGFRDSFHPTPAGDWNLKVVLGWIRDGLYAYEINRVRHVLARDGKRAYDRVKAQLQAFTFGGTFYPTRGIAYLRQHSGLVVGDLDHLPDVTAVKRAICTDPRTVFAFQSPSETGLKVGVHVPIAEDGHAYKHIWQVVAAEFERLYGARWDPSGKDICRLCFVSYDSALYANFAAVRFDVPPPPSPEPPPVPQTSPPMTTTKPNRSSQPQDYAERAINTAVDMIHRAPLGTRHHTRLKAARLLGGFVGGGLLSEDQAYGALAQALVGHTEDLHRALKTVEDGLAYGQAHPITLEALEAERRARLREHQSRHAATHWDPPADSPWAGMNTLPIRPYMGYRGVTMRGGSGHG
jgi:VirE N-terminal domain